MIRGTLALCLLLSGCRFNPRCNDMEARYLLGGPSAQAAQLRAVCKVALARAAEPPSARPSHEELERQAFEDCVDRPSPAAINACLARHGCRFAMISHAGPEPVFSCL